MRSGLRWALTLALGILGTASLVSAQEESQERPLSRLTTQVCNLTEGVRPYLVRVIRVDSDPVRSDQDPKRILGSGICLGEGRILTTCSVVGAADSVTVVTADKKQYRAKVTGIDRRTNVALLELPGVELPPIPTTRKSILFPGDFVVAVGFGPPMGPQASFGTVILASKGHSLQYTEVEMVQVTAPAFPGFSGGVLLSSRGEMVGMLTGRMTLDPEEAVIPPETGMVAGYLDRDRIYTTSLSEATLVLPAGLAVGTKTHPLGSLSTGLFPMVPRTGGGFSRGT
jgi:S1-C subfamily serine protease